MSDKGQQEIRERVWIEKFDHSGDVPRLVEVVHVEATRRPDGRVDVKVEKVEGGE